MAKKKKVLYLLGAGASAAAVPVLEGWKDGLSLFRDHVGRLTSNLPLRKDMSAEEVSKFSSTFSLIVKDIDFLLEQSLGHYTVDTFAKKLYIKGNNEDLRRLKKIVTLFILFCQTVSRVQGRNNRGGEDSDRITRDNRYDTLLSFLMNKNEKEIPGHCKFISWNYDTQFELALNDYIENPDATVARVTDNTKQFFKINGTIGTVRNESGGDNSAITLFYWQFNKNIQHEQLFCQLYESMYQLSNDRMGIRYAWEQPNNDYLVDRLEKLELYDIDFVVIIGYSFPFFNRSVDREILERLSKTGLKIYLQYPDGQHESIVEKLRGFDLVGLDLEVSTKSQQEAAVVFIKDIDTFYVPYGV